MQKVKFLSKEGCVVVPLESLLPLFFDLFVMIVSCGDIQVTTSNSKHLQPDHFYQLFFKCFVSRKKTCTDYLCT